MSQETDDAARRMGIVTAENIGCENTVAAAFLCRRGFFSFAGFGIMAKYKTREAYLRAHGQGWLAHEVSIRTVAELQSRGIRPDPESLVYQKTFDRLSARYRDELTAQRKAKNRAEAEWLAQHKTDADEELLAYLRTAVTEPEQLKKTTLVTGGPHIAAHFGGWQKALALAGLVEPEQETQISK